jgi:hypothetical protein
MPMSAITKPDIKRVEEAICNPITSSEGSAIRPPPNPVKALPKTAKDVFLSKKPMPKT